MIIKTRLSTMNHDMSSNVHRSVSVSTFYRSVNVHYIRQEEAFSVRRDSSLPFIEAKSIEAGNSVLDESVTTEPLERRMALTPRNVAVLELITSEQRFVHDMNNILKTFIVPMLTSHVLSSSHVDALFLNWPSLTRTHEKLTNALLLGLKTDGENVPIGNILCEFFPELMAEYEVYFRFQPTATKCFREQLATSSKFRAFMQKAKGHSRGIGTMGDATILTLPLQRIAKYPFMIYQILKSTSDDCPDRLQLDSSLRQANELRQTINNVIEEEINRVKFDWLQKHVDCTKINEAIIFNSLTHFGDQRRLIHYSHVRLSAKAHRLVYAMLFNDFLLLTRAKRPLIAKIFQLLRRTASAYHREGEHRLDRTSIRSSNLDWFDSPDTDHLYLTMLKKPIMLHEIQNVRIVANDAISLQFEYRGRRMVFFTSSSNQRLLWMKSLDDAINISRRQRQLASMFRAPALNTSSTIQPSVGKLFIQVIHAVNLPLSSIQKNGCHPYCIMELNRCQRQTTPIVSDRLHVQWNVFFRFRLDDIQNDTIHCSIYNRSTFNIDRLLGSVEIPVALFLEQRCSPEDFSSMYSTTSLSEHVSLQWKRRTFHLEHSSKNSQLSLEYLIQFDE